jgi:RNA polymerase sigma factor for flagellar operon FliA
MTTPSTDTTDDARPARSSSEIKSMDRAELVERFRGYVHGIADDLYEPDHHHFEFEDVCAYGYQGLLEAHDRFDPDHEASFMNFAYYRIHGAICDGLRASQWSSRHRNVELEDHFESPKSDEAPGHYGKEESARADTVPMGVENADEEDAVRILLMHRSDVEHLEHTNGSPQHQTFQGRRVGERLEEALETLSEMERELVLRYYIRGETLESIADDLGCSKSWASRLRRRALDDLDDALPELEGDEVETISSRDRAA